MRVAALVFLILICLRFPYSKSVAEVIRKRYGQNTVKKLGKLEKLDFRLHKPQIDLQFSVNCSNNFVVPKLNVPAAKSLKSSRTYQQCQLKLLRSLSEKTLIQVFDLHSALRIETNFIDFAQLYSLFLEHDDKVLKQKSTIQPNKFNNLLQHTKRCMIPRKFFFKPPLIPAYI